MKKIEKKYLIAGGAVIVVIAIAAGFFLKQKMTAKPAALNKITGEIVSVADNKSTLTLKSDTITYQANMDSIKTIKNNAGEKISLDKIKAGDKVELRTRTNLKGGQVTKIEAYSIKDLSISAEPKQENTDSKK